MKWWDGHSCNSAMCVFSRSDQVNMALGCFRCHLGIIHALWATFTAGMGRRLRVLWSTSLRRWRIRLPENLCSQWCSMWDNKTLWLLMVASCLDHQPTGRGSCSRIGAWSKGQGQGTRAANQQSRARGAVVRGAFRYPKKWKREQREVLWHKAFMQDMQAWPMARLYLNFAIFGGRIMWVPVGACIYIWWPWHLQIAHYQHFNEIAFTVHAFTSQSSLVLSSECHQQLLRHHFFTSKIIISHPVILKQGVIIWHQPNQCTIKGRFALFGPQKLGNLHPGKLTCPQEKRPYFKRTCIFQPSFFRKYIKISGK